ncbi:MAG: NTP/NDP exchange transporter [Acidiferrobacterales bacterium]
MANLVDWLLKQVVSVREGEIRALFLSFAYFFCVLCSYYILRPVRDEMGIQGGVENLHWLFTGTFVAMLVAVPVFAAAAARLPRGRLLPWAYGFFIVNLLIFFALFHSDIATTHVARAFFIWVSVFNLFVVSVFWSFMADLFRNEQARRLFGFIAAGGSAGAIIGPALTGILATRFGPVNLLLLSAFVLLLAVWCIHQLNRWAAKRAGRSYSVAKQTAEHGTADAPATAPLGGSVLSGVKRVFRSPYLLGICLYIWLHTTLATFLYFEQAHIVAEAFVDSGQRTALFAYMDLSVNALTVFGQLFLVARIVRRFGLALTLAVVPALVALGFLVLAVSPVLAVLVVFQVLRRAGNFAIARPAREMLFTVLAREEKYKSKNFIDTVVYRGGDAASAWAFAGLTALGLGLSAIAFVAVPLAIGWVLTGLWLGRKQERLDPAAGAEGVRLHASSLP